LYCSSSNLSSLDVSAAGSNLSILECNYNNLTKLDLSQNINLSRLLCDCNNLVALDLSADTVSIDAENFSCVGNVMEVKVDGAGKMDLHQ
jgi:Leucine-rich repeat (LRR) protein